MEGVSFNFMFSDIFRAEELMRCGFSAAWQAVFLSYQLQKERKKRGW